MKTCKAPNYHTASSFLASESLTSISRSIYIHLLSVLLLQDTGSSVRLLGLTSLEASSSGCC